MIELSLYLPFFSVGLADITWLKVPTSNHLVGLSSLASPILSYRLSIKPAISPPYKDNPTAQKSQRFRNEDWSQR